jgi:DNA topoisomerase IB
MVINNNSVEQINVALLDIEKKLKTITLDAKELNTLQNTVDLIRRSLNETKSGLTSGNTYNINITGNATSATYATNAGNATYATNADKATKDANGNVINTTYQKAADMDDYQEVSEKDTKAGYVHCDKTANGTYILVATVANGSVTYSWQART